MIPTKLNKEQEQVLDAVRQKKSVFFTGSAGTGKSFVLKHLIEKVIDKSTTEITGSTGLAAVAIGGTTFHSFSGVGLGNLTVEKILLKMTPKQKDRIKRATTVILDEVSLINGDLFDKIEKVVKSVRQNQLPFGGIQLVRAFF